MKKIFISKKITFIAVITITALVHTHGSLAHLIDSTGKNITTAIPIKNFDKYTLKASQPFDVIENHTNQPIKVTIYSSASIFCPKFQVMNIPALHLMEISSAPTTAKMFGCNNNPKNRKTVEIEGPYGKKTENITVAHQGNGSRTIRVGSAETTGSEAKPSYTIHIF